MRWRWFVGAAFLAAYTVWRLGAPMFAVVAGIVLAALWNARKMRPGTANR